MNGLTQKERYNMEDLLEIVALLRDPENGCPWDKVQTHTSIRKNFIEETYEVADAIDLADASLLCEELGDVLLQVALHTRMEEEQGAFTFGDVCTGICKKLIYRHPHVFGNVAVSGSDEVLVNWEELKRKEKHQESAADSVDAVARSLPGLWRAEKVQKKAAKAGFDWPDIQGALEKLREEHQELEEAIQSGTNVSEELGDLLFAAVNVSRFVKVDPEEALTAATDKFISRFRKVEAIAAQEGRDMAQMGLSELDQLWERAKRT